MSNASDTVSRELKEILEKYLENKLYKSKRL